jgi:hypothetical protein
MSAEDRGTPKEESGFKVSDRRMFTAEGEPIDRAETQADHPENRTTSERVNPKSFGEPTARSGEEVAAIDFASFVLSLATSAMACLGEVPDPSTGKTVVNLDGAKQMIDILSMLEEKTRGNRDPDEERLLDGLLYELRMGYLKKKQVIKL